MMGFAVMLLFLLILVISSSFDGDLSFLHSCAWASTVEAFQFTNRGKGGGSVMHGGLHQKECKQALDIESFVWGYRSWHNHDERMQESTSTLWKSTSLFAVNGQSSSSSPSSSSSSTTTISSTVTVTTKPLNTATSTRKRKFASDSALQQRRQLLLTDVLSQMSSPRLLKYLDTYHIRYAPTATRHDLEQLVLSHVITTKDGRMTNSNDGERSRRNNGRGAKKLEQVVLADDNIERVLDAEVIDDGNAAQQINMASGGITREGLLPQQQQQHQQRRVFWPPNQSRKRLFDNTKTGQREQYGGSKKRASQDRSRGRSQGRVKEYALNDHDEDSDQSRRDHHYRSQSTRQQDVQEGGRRNYNLYASKKYFHHDSSVPDSDVIDLDDEFRLDDEEDPRSQIYDNGLQIFLMGFYEAGKAATRLVTDAVVDAVHYGGNGASAKRWRYDDDMEEEQEGREWEIVDANILNYSPQVRGHGSQRRRRQNNNDDYYGNGVKRHHGQRGNRGEARQDEYATNHHVERHVLPRRSVVSNKEPLKERWGTLEEGGIPQYMPPSEIPIETDVERRVSTDYAISGSKRIYGVYADRALQNQSGSEEIKAEQELHHKRQWKDRLRRKFDDALGFHSSASSSVTSQESYYESWKKQMESVDDGRKEVLRRQLNEKHLSSSINDSSKPKIETPSTYRNNRRARMRANSSVAKTPPPSSSRRLYNESFQRSRLDEVPCWREGGTIASLLFDNRQPPTSPKRRSRTLEQLLLSPFGRGHSVTSLFLYISRSILAAFGILCRWAGVRGTIPQPIVVVSVVAILVGSRRGQRMMSLAFTILVMRLVGEFIHGSIHGNEFWSDEYDFSSHNWKNDNHSR